MCCIDMSFIAISMWELITILVEVMHSTPQVIHMILLIAREARLFFTTVIFVFWCPLIATISPLLSTTKVTILSMQNNMQKQNCL